MTEMVMTEWKAGQPETPRLHALTEAIAREEVLDGPAEALAGAFSSTVEPGPLKDLLSGTWLGHALHPLLTDATLAFYVSASTLDLVGGEDSRRAAERLVGLGLLSTVPTAVTGLNDWTDTTKSDAGARRVGVAHAAANVAASVLYGASLLARKAGARRFGVGLGLLGLGAIGVGGHLGGHLTYGQGVGVDQTTFRRPLADWTPALAEDELPEGEATAADVDGVTLLLYRDGDRVYALDARCCHRGGPLHDGEVADGCVTCPWHKSVFRLEDGAVVRGPAAYPQPAYDVRVADGQILVRGPANG